MTLWQRLWTKISVEGAYLAVVQFAQAHHFDWPLGALNGKVRVLYSTHGLRQNWALSVILLLKMNIRTIVTPKTHRRRQP